MVPYHFSIKDEDIGSYIIQQNVRGKPVSVFRFPPRTKMRASTNITVSCLRKTFLVLLVHLEIPVDNALKRRSSNSYLFSFSYSSNSYDFVFKDDICS